MGNPRGNAKLKIQNFKFQRGTESFYRLILSYHDWLLLAQYYLTDISLPPNSSTWQTGRVNFVSYRNSLNIGVTEEGLYLSFIFLMRLFHPPILIPWESITKVNINSFDEYDIYIDIPIFPGNPSIITLSKKSLNNVENILITKKNVK